MKDLEVREGRVRGSGCWSGGTRLGAGRGWQRPEEVSVEWQAVEFKPKEDVQVSRQE